MLEKLPKSKYHLIKNFLSTPHLKLNIRPILNESFSGFIYVDNIDEPIRVYVWDSRVAHFLLGDWKRKEDYSLLFHFLKHEIIPILENEKKSYYLMYTNNWKYFNDNTDEILFPDPILVKRELYQFNKIQIMDWKKDIPKGFELVRVSRELIHMDNLENMEGLVNELKYMWGNPEKFFQYGFGYCIKTAAKLVGWCLGEYYSDEGMEKMFGIGIEVYPEFQRMGFATLLASALVEEGEKQGYQIYWDCLQNNQGSVKTALKVGFRLLFEYDEFQGTFDEFSRFLSKAAESYRQGRFDEAIEWYKKALMIKSDVDWVYWNIAVMFKKLNDLDSSFKYLEHAIQNGWSNIDYMNKSEHFRDVQDNPRWIAIISLIKVKNAKK